MAKESELLDAWTKTQQEFLETWMKSQQQFFSHWTESAKKLQDSFAAMGEGKEGLASKELLGLYGTWVNTMVNSTRLFSEEAVKIQETWKSTFDKQLEISREVLKSFSALYQKADKS